MSLSGSSDSDSDNDDLMLSSDDDRFRSVISMLQAKRRRSTESDSSDYRNSSDSTSEIPSFVPKKVEITESLKRYIEKVFGTGKYDLIEYHDLFEHCVVCTERESGEKRNIRWDYFGLLGFEKDVLETEKVKRFLETRNPHLVRIFGYATDESKFLYVTNHYQYGSLRDVLRIIEEKENRNHFYEREISCIVKSILIGLSFLHKRNIVSREVKGDNIFLDCETGTPKLGVLSCLPSISKIKNWGNLNKRGTIIGNPYWDSPEVILNDDEPYNPPRDIWSLGMTVIELAEGKNRYEGANPMRAYFLIPKKPPPTFENPTYWSEEMNHFLALCLQKEAHKRPTSSELLRHPWITNNQWSGKDQMVLVEMVEKYVEGKACRLERLDEKERIGYILQEGIMEELKILISLKTDEDNSRPKTTRSVLCVLLLL